MNPERFDLFEDALNEGFAASGGRHSLDTFEIAPFVQISIGDDLDACRRPIKELLALYVGGMGARDKNFYTDYVKRLGYAEAADAIQDAFLDGRRADAVAAVPDALIDEVALVGPPSRIAERLGVWKDAAAKGWVDSLLLGGADVEALRVVAEEVL